MNQDIIDSSYYGNYVAVNQALKVSTEAGFLAIIHE
jgi:hypothetical protein